MRARRSGAGDQESKLRLATLRIAVAHAEAGGRRGATFAAMQDMLAGRSSQLQHRAAAAADMAHGSSAAWGLWPRRCSRRGREPDLWRRILREWPPTCAHVCTCLHNDIQPSAELAFEELNSDQRVLHVWPRQRGMELCIQTCASRTLWMTVVASRNMCLEAWQRTLGRMGVSSSVAHAPQVRRRPLCPGGAARPVAAPRTCMHRPHVLPRALQLWPR